MRLTGWTDRWQYRCARLDAYCRDWGGALHFMPGRLWGAAISQMQFSHRVGLDWDSCHVFGEHYSAWPLLIHEMAHCFAMREPPHLAGPNEPVGWQFLLACSLDVDAGRDWLTFYRSFGLNVGRDFREMSDPEIAEYMSWTVIAEQNMGLLDGITPLAVRRGPGL